MIDIGDWNMNATSSVTVAHGLTAANIRSVDVQIRDDETGLNTIPLDYDASGTGASGRYGFLPNGTTIQLLRLAGGTFDTTAYNSISYNRGWITIWYV